jgi:hypothetical protein
VPTLNSDGFTDLIKRSINATEIGQSIITIKAYHYDSTEYEEYKYLVNVVKNDMSLSTVTTDIALFLNAFGKSNSSSDRNKWEYSGITTTFHENEYLMMSTIKQDGTVIKPDDATSENTKEVQILPSEDIKGYKYILCGGKHYKWARQFDWSNTSGWNDNKLKLSNGNAITINYAPFSKNYAQALKERGATFEFDFETTNVYNDDAIICKIVGDKDNAPGIIIYASGAELVISREIVKSRYVLASVRDFDDNVIVPPESTENNTITVDVLPSEENKDYKFIIFNDDYYTWHEETDNVGYIKSVSTKFKSEESNRISFVITPDKEDSDTKEYRDRILKIYVNGEICGAYPYEKGTNFSNESKITFMGTEDACVNISSLKFYKKALNSNEILGNYIYYINDTNKKSETYRRNDVMKIENKEAFDSDKLLSQLPVMTFYQIKESDSLDDIHQEKKNKKLTKFFDVVYVDLQNPQKNFYVHNAYITPQGTSSMNYPVKNLRLYTGKKDESKVYYSRLFVGEDIFKGGSYNGPYNDTNKKLEDNVNIETEVDKDEKGKDLKRKYAFKEGSIPVNCWCLKADFAESSSSHNTGTARYWNNVLKSNGYLTKAQTKAKAVGYPYDVRTSIDGFPIAVFYRGLNSETIRFEGKYNFNNDKSTEDVFGFTGGDKVSEQEYKYFYIGQEQPQVIYDDKKNEWGCTFDFDGLTDITGSINDESPLYVLNNDESKGLKGYYMLRGKNVLDNPKMECWEILNSVNEIALFKTMDGFGIGDDGKKVGIVDKESDGTEKFYEAFESRYPDCGRYYHTNSLRRFGEWLVSCRYLDIDQSTGECIPFKNLPRENYHTDGDKGVFSTGKLSICSLSKKTGEFEFDFPNHNFYREIDFNLISTNIKAEGYREIKFNTSSDTAITNSITYLDVKTIPSKKINTHEYKYLKLNDDYYKFIDNAYALTDVSGEVLSEDDYIEVNSLPQNNFTEYEYLKCNNIYFTWMPSNVLETNEIPKTHETSYDYILVNKKYYHWSNKFKFEDYHPLTGTTDTPSVWVEDTAFNRALKFAIEKYDHIEMDKMAAYYIYLMRFGGVDQTVKNAMLTTEGPLDVYDSKGNVIDITGSTLPSLWYFINYDNDTILGVKNDGRLVFDPYITRQTPDGSGYVYAGRESTLWNNLEADKQFMDKVTEVDNKLANGDNNTNSEFLLSYNNAIREYDTNQSDKWCETIYNKDAERKYIQTYVDGWVQKIEEDKTEKHVYEDYLYDVQGSRSSHRKWWLGRRFNVFDSRFCNANFRSQLIKFRSTNLPSGKSFSIKSGEPIFYAWGQDNSVSEITKKAILPGETCTFTTKSAFNIGSYLEVMGSANIVTFNLRDCVGALTEIDINGCYSQSIGTKLKELLIGDKDRNDLINISSTQLKFSGLEQAAKLEILDMTNIKNAYSFDGLKKLLNIKEVYAKGTSVSLFEFADGAMIEKLELPRTTDTLSLIRSSMITYDNISFEGNKYGNLMNLTINNCSKLMNDFNFVINWIKTLSNEQKENVKLNLSGIHWTINSNSLNDLLKLENVGTSAIGEFNITGRIELVGINVGLEIASKLQKIFGVNCFKQSSGLFIDTTTKVFIKIEKELWEGDEDIQCKVLILNETTNGEITLNLSVYDGNNQNVDPQIFSPYIYYSLISDGVYKIHINESDNDFKYLSLNAIYKPDKDGSIYYKDDQSYTIKKRIYPTGIKINSLSDSFNDLQNHELTLIYEPNDINDKQLNGRGLFSVTWEIIEGTEGYLNGIYLSPNTNESAIIKATKELDVIVKVKATLKRNYNNDLTCTAEKTFTFTNPNTILTEDSNKRLFDILVKAGIISTTGDTMPKLTGNEAANITIEDLTDKKTNKSIFYDTNITSFLEFQHFTGIGGKNNDGTLKTLPYLFANCKSLKEISIPQTFEYAENGMFSGCTSLEHIYGPRIIDNNSEIPSYYELPFIDVADNFAYNCNKLVTCKLSFSLTHIGKNAFYNCSSLNLFNIPNNENLIIDYDSNSNPFTGCKDINFETGTVKYIINDYSLYEKIDENTLNLIHMGNNSLTSNIPTDKTVIAYAYSMEYRTEPNPVIPINVTFNGDKILRYSTGNTITFNNSITDSTNCNRLLENTKFNGNYKFNGEITRIPNGCFYDVKDMSNFIVPYGVKNIISQAFYGASNLNSITLPETLEKIETQVFWLANLNNIYINGTTPPILQSDLFYGGLAQGIYVQPESLIVFKESNNIDAILKPLILPSKLFSKGYVKIVKDNEYFTDTEQITVGGLSVTMTSDSDKPMFMEYSTTEDVIDLSVRLNGIEIGKITDEITTIYTGNNNLLVQGDGYDFTVGIHDDELKTDLSEKGWFYDQMFKGVRTLPGLSDGSSTEHTFSIPSLENKSIEVEYGTYFRKKSYNNNVFAVFTTDTNEIKDEDCGYNKRISLINSNGKITIKFTSGVIKEGIDGIVINKIGNAYYTDPELVSSARANTYRTVEVELNADEQIPSTVYVTLTDNKAYTFSKAYEGNSVLFNVPFGREFIAYANDFVSENGKAFTLKQNVNVNENKIYLEYDYKYGIEIKDDVLCYHADNTDWYIKLERKYGKWGNVNISEINTTSIEVSDANGLDNTMLIAKETSDSIFNEAIKYSNFEDGIFGYIPSYVEVLEFSQYLDDINEYLTHVKRENIVLDGIWISQSLNEKNAYNSNSEIVSKEEILPYYIFGKRITY